MRRLIVSLQKMVGFEVACHCGGEANTGMDLGRAVLPSESCSQPVNSRYRPGNSGILHKQASGLLNVSGWVIFLCF